MGTISFASSGQCRGRLSSSSTRQPLIKIVFVALLAALLCGRVAAEKNDGVLLANDGDHVAESAKFLAPSALDVYLAAGEEARPIERTARAVYCYAGKVSSEGAYIVLHCPFFRPNTHSHS